MELPKRKKNRLEEYNYSAPNAYFITICTDRRKNFFWNSDSPKIVDAQDVRLSQYGMIADEAIRNIGERYPAVSVDKYVVMPNHVHLLLQIHSDNDGRPMAAPTISTIVNQMKGAVSKKAGFSVWQKSFIIRGENDYREVWAYIEGNPSKWMEDILCVETTP